MPIEDQMILPRPEEQFVSREQQREAATFGMWIFLATEVLLFGGLLVLYAAYRIWYPQEFQTGSRHLDLPLGTVNTAILLTSSFFMDGAVTASRMRDRRTTLVLITLTAICGAAFLGIKGYEWSTAIHEGFWPGSQGFATPAQPDATKLFFSLYFILTGLHGLHLFIGISLLLGTAFRLAHQKSFAPNQNLVSVLGLYWHFVDVVWIFLYPLLYLIGRSTS